MKTLLTCSSNRREVGFDPPAVTVFPPHNTTDTTQLAAFSFSTIVPVKPSAGVAISVTHNCCTVLFSFPFCIGTASVVLNSGQACPGCIVVNVEDFPV